MRALLLTNPKAGTGRGVPEAIALSDALRADGMSVNVLQVGEAATRLLESPAMQRADALVVMGGDGTLHHAADLAIETGLPLYHYPMGNENLFAREFGHSRAHERVIRTIRARNVLRADAGMANGTSFVIMASVGIDAGIVHRVARGRKKAIGHRSYVLPGIAEVLRPTLPRLTIRVDGESLCKGLRGTAVIANSRRYGVDLDPARHAKVDDGLLDVVVYPAGSALAMARWLLLSRYGKHLNAKGLLYATGRDISIETTPEQSPVQVDGEAPGVSAGDKWPAGPKARTPLRVELMPSVLPVLIPPDTERE
ncbi:MAG: diacylglycerol kinase family protein [Planctomycetota bacterium]